MRPDRTALLILDLQEGLLGRSFAPLTAEAVLERSIALATAMRRAGALVIVSRVAWAPDFADSVRRPMERPMPVSADGMSPDWADLPPALQAQADLVITRRQWGAFHGTELDLQLRRREIDTLVLAGITTNFGIESTARAANEHDYGVVFALDAISGIAADLHDFALEHIFPRIGLKRTCAEIVAALG